MAANDSASDLLESLLYKLFPNVYDSAMYASVKVALFVTDSSIQYLHFADKNFQEIYKQSELRY